MRKTMAALSGIAVAGAAAATASDTVSKPDVVSPAILAQANDPVILSRDILQMATTRALGGAETLLLEGGIVAEADQVRVPDLQGNVERLQEMADGFTAVMDPAEAEDMQIVYMMGAEDARLGFLTIEDLDAAARTIVQLDAEIAARAAAATAFMTAQGLNDDQVIAMADRTRTIMATGGPDCMMEDSWAMAPGEEALLADIAELWGGMGDALFHVRTFNDPPAPDATKATWVDEQSL